MPRATDGTYSLPPGSIVNSGDTILPSQHNPALTDLGQAISNSLDRDGRGGMRAPLSMGGQRIANMANGVLPSDAATVVQASVPIGTVLDYAGLTQPPGYFFAFGALLPVSDFQELFAVIGYRFGGSGASFALPDLRGRVVAGSDTMGGGTAGRLTPGNVGDTLGTQSHTLVVGEMPSHAHNGTTAAAGSHSHDMGGFSGAVNNSGGLAGSSDVGTANTSITSENGLHSHVFTTDSTGSGQPHNNVQPTFVLNKIIKVKG